MKVTSKDFEIKIKNELCKALLFDGRESKSPHLEKKKVPSLEDELISPDVKLGQPIKIDSIGEVDAHTNKFTASKNNDIESEDRTKNKHNFTIESSYKKMT